MAQMTINTTSEQDARLVVAFGKFLNLGRNATGPEIKAAIISWVRKTVLREEQSTLPPFDPT